MCMTIGHSVPGSGSLIATDVRTGVLHDESGELRSPGWDSGGKLVRSERGFAVGTGSQAAVFTALEAFKSGVLAAVAPALSAANFSPPVRSPAQNREYKGDKIFLSGATPIEKQSDCHIALMSIDA